MNKYLFQMILAWKTLTSWLSFVMSNYEFVTFLGQVWYLIVSIPYLCTLTYFGPNIMIPKIFFLITRHVLYFELYVFGENASIS